MCVCLLFFSFQFLELDFMPNPPRGCSYLYGHGAVEPFLKANNLVGMIRAHQCKEEGVGFAYTDNRVIDYKFPYITTVFTASNYCGTHGNKAAVMIFLKDDIQVSEDRGREREGGGVLLPILHL